MGLESKKKILLVDDDKEIVEGMKLPLMVHDYEIHEAYDGLKALEIIRKIHPDLVVLDVLMPKLDGFKLTRLFKFDERFKYTPVIMVSNIRKVQDQTLLDSIGVNQFFSKPVNTDVLTVEIQKLLKESERSKKK